jgi:glycosyltransferase involved in cell wall biosynthesis
MKPEVSLILPSLNRAQKLVSTIDNFYNTNGGISIEIIVILSDEDIGSRNRLDKLGILYSLIPTSNPVIGWNFGAKLSKGEWLYIASDDVVHPKLWLEKSLNTKNLGFLAISDGRVRENFEPFYMATRTWLKENQNGVLAVPHYRHWGIDPEVCGRAIKGGSYIKSPIIVTHNHPIYGTTKKDSTYKRAEKFYKKDVALFHTRRKLGFPNDFEGYL